MASEGPRTHPAWGLLWVGWVLVTCIVLGYFLGSWLDEKLGTTPWLMVTCFFLGVGAGFMELFRSIARFQK